MKIAQLSDLHIPPGNELVYDIDSRAGFKRAWQSVLSWQPDLVAVTGDLPYRETDVSGYAWLKEYFGQAGVPVIPAAGNHDLPAEMTKRFPFPAALMEAAGWHLLACGLKGVHACMVNRGKNSRDIELIFLDSSGACLSKEQKNWVLDNCSAGADSRVVFMHHPPVLCGHNFMDRRWALTDIAETEVFLKELSMSAAALDVFCGHYHFDRTVETGYGRVHVCPSTFMQLDPDSEKFRISSRDIGWKKITADSGTVRQETVWLKSESDY